MQSGWPRSPCSCGAASLESEAGRAGHSRVVGRVPAGRSRARGRVAARREDRRVSDGHVLRARGRSVVRAAVRRSVRAEGAAARRAALPLVAASSRQVEALCGPLGSATGAAGRGVLARAAVARVRRAGVGQRRGARGAAARVAVRVPAHPVARALAEAWGAPVTATSANRTRRAAARAMRRRSARSRSIRAILVIDAGRDARRRAVDDRRRARRRARCSSARARSPGTAC